MTYDNPETDNLYHSVVHIGCVAAQGQSTEQEVFDAIWGKFQSLGIHSVTIHNGAVVDNALLNYYGIASSNPTVKNQIFIESVDGVLQPPSQFPTFAREFAANATYNTFFTKGLLAKSDGTCGAWTYLMIDVLGAQGIMANKLGIVVQPFIIGVFPAFKVKSLPGQGTSSPKESIWMNHIVVGYNGNVYDPSYGKFYGVKAGAIQQFMTLSIESVGWQVRPKYPGDIEGYGAAYEALTSWNPSNASLYLKWED